MATTATKTADLDGAANPSPKAERLGADRLHVRLDREIDRPAQIILDDKLRKRALDLFDVLEMDGKPDQEVRLPVISVSGRREIVIPSLKSRKRQWPGKTARRRHFEILFSVGIQVLGSDFDADKSPFLFTGDFFDKGNNGRELLCVLGGGLDALQAVLLAQAGGTGDAT